MKSHALLIILTLFLSFACRQKKSETHLITKDSTVTAAPDADDSLIEAKRDSIYAVFSKMSVDTSRYSNLPYWDTTIDRYGKAYVDSFSEGGGKFRLISPSNTPFNGGNSIFLEQYQNGHWVNKTQYVEDDHGGNLHRDRDINNDGFADITNNTHWMQEVYFYNPSTNSFDTSSDNPDIINNDWELIDTSRNIFCDFNEFKDMPGQIHSSLYTYNKFTQVFLYQLELDNSSVRDSANLITKLILRKYNPNTGVADDVYEKPIEVLKLKKPIDIEGYDDHGKYPNGSDRYFDYVAYWKGKYKKLLGYQ